MMQCNSSFFCNMEYTFRIAKNPTILQPGSKCVPRRVAARSQGTGREGQTALSMRIQVVLVSVYLSKASGDLSRPTPLCLKPPNGTVTSSSSYWLTGTVPARKARATPIALLMSRLQTAGRAAASHHLGPHAHGQIKTVGQVRIAAAISRARRRPSRATQML